MTLFFNKDVVVREKVYQEGEPVVEVIEGDDNSEPEEVFVTRDEKSTKTTIPFLKNNELDYANLLAFLGKDRAQRWGWLVLIMVVIVVVTAVSNSANITDGLDGLAAGSSAIIGVTLGVLAYLSGNFVYASNIQLI